MKKILTIALVALLAASTAFAGLSGKATLSLGYDTASKSYGFKNGSSFSVDLNVESLEAEKVQEGDIYAGAKATLTLKLADRYGSYAPVFVKNGAASLGLGVIVSLDDAYIAGKDWKVSITGTPDELDFAKSAVDTYFTGKFTKDAFGGYNKKVSRSVWAPVSYAVDVYSSNGITATYKDWKVGLGFEGGEADLYLNTSGEEITKDQAISDSKYTSDYKSGTGAPKFFNYHISLFTPSLELADGITLKAGAVASGVKNATKTYSSSVTVSTGATTAVKGYEESENFDAFGASVEGAYASDAFSGKLALDFGMTKTVGKEKFVPGLDVAANAVVSLVTLDAYYKYDGNETGKAAHFVSAQLAADLNTFEVPVVIKAYGKNILVDKKLGGEVSGTLDAVTLKVGGSYTISTKKYGVEGSVGYKADMFKASVGANFSKTVGGDDQQLYATASVESDALVPGATLKLAYEPNTKDADDKSYSYATSNFLKGSDFGAVTATCTIKF